MEDAIQQHLRQIFPQVDGCMIQICVEEAKRSVDVSSVDILPLCIDLILGCQAQKESRDQNVEGPNDDIIFVGSKKVDLGSRNFPLVYVDDEWSESPGEFSTGDKLEDIPDVESEVNIHSDSEFYSATVSYNQTGQKFNAIEPVPVMSHEREPSLKPTSVLQFVTQMFPDVNRDRVKDLASEGWNLNQIVNHLLENAELRNATNTALTTSPPEASASQKDIDYFKEYTSPVSNLYHQQCLALLKNDFRKLYALDIKAAMRKYNSHYAPTRKCLEDSLLAIGHSGGGDSSGSDTNSIYTSSSIPLSSTMNAGFSTITIKKLLACKRNVVPLSGVLEKELVNEMEFIKKQNMLEEEKKDEIYAVHLNEQQYEEEGQQIECGCCYGEFPFENIVQCSDGHLFCSGCLKSYAKEVIFGSAIATAKLHCMSDGCTKPFPYSQLRKCLSAEEIEKYQERLQEDCLMKVDLPNLVRCPFCEFAAILADEEKVFTCLNPKCRKETCRDCQEEWKDHFGLKCSEVEKKCETDLRLTYEEKMTIAKVRKCPKCSCQFMKSEGCNKMTCRCGQTMCYICRKPGINYVHFCRHPRDPGKRCDQCTACSLWSDPSEDEELAVKQLEQEAEAAKRKLIEDLTLSAKKQKV